MPSVVSFSLFCGPEVMFPLILAAYFHIPFSKNYYKTKFSFFPLFIWRAFFASVPILL